MITGRAVRSIALIALGAIGYYIVAVVALAVLHPELSILERPISAYQSGRHPLLTASTFVALALAIAALNLALAATVVQSRWATVGSLLLWIAVAGVVIAAIFPHAPMHAVARVMTFPPLLIGAVLLSLATLRTPGWRELGRVALTLAYCSVALFVIAVLGFGSIGLAELGQLVFFFAWMAIIALRIARAPTPQAVEP